MADADSWEWATWADEGLEARVAAVTTSRRGGFSKGEFASFNLAAHVSDDPSDVARNRRDLLETLGASRVQWLDQVHGTGCVEATLAGCHTVPEADAAWTGVPGLVLAVLTADCLPVVVAARDASIVAVVHAGWRGLVAGIIPSALGELPSRAGGYLGWIGPAIGAAAYEVGEDVAEAVRQLGPKAEVCLSPGNRAGKHLLDLAGLATRQLAHAGIEDVQRSTACTWSDDRFYSYRRDGATGRQATLVWIR